MVYRREEEKNLVKIKNFYFSTLVDPMTYLTTFPIVQNTLAMS